MHDASQWAEGPFNLIRETGADSIKDMPQVHPVIVMAKNMALTHNIILRAINASYAQCLKIKAGSVQASDFMLFNQALYEVLTIHHDVEEEYLFPEIQRLSGDPHIMDTNLQEHKDFHEGLDRFKQYVFETDPSKYNGQDLRTLLDGFGKAVELHLHHEIPTLLNLHIYDAAAIANIARVMHDRTLARSSKHRHFPLFVGCADRTFKLDGQTESFPKIPYIILWAAKHFFEPRYAGAWKFNPSDTFGQPRACLFDV